MAWFVNILLIAAAFNAEEWLVKREMLSREAERLQQAYSECVKKLESPAEGVNIPVETYPDGSVKLEITASRAQFFLKEELVWAEDVEIVRYEDDHTVSSRIKAERCVFDRNTKSGWAEGAAKIVFKDTEFTGNGVYFSSPENYVMSKENSKIVSHDLKFGGVL